MNTNLTGWKGSLLLCVCVDSRDGFCPQALRACLRLCLLAKCCQDPYILDFERPSR